MAFEKIQEYLNTADGNPGTLLIPKLIMPMLIEEVDKVLLPRELAAVVIKPNQIQGSSFNYNLEAPNTMDVREVGEGAEIPLDNLGFSSVTFTPVKYGVAIRITREMMEDSQFNIFERNLRAAGRRFAENETALILTALDGAANAVSGGAAVTVANFSTAIQNLEDNDFEATDILVGNEVLNDMRNIDTFVEANKAGNTEMLDTGFKGTLFGASVSRFSTNAAPTTTYSKYAYVFDRRQAYGIAIKRDITVENFSLATFDMEGAAITQRIDVKLLRSAAVSNITTS